MLIGLLYGKYESLDYRQRKARMRRRGRWAVRQRTESQAGEM